jgi:hypothetical protein
MPEKQEARFSAMQATSGRRGKAARGALPYDSLVFIRQGISSQRQVEHYNHRRRARSVVDTQSVFDVLPSPEQSAYHASLLASCRRRSSPLEARKYLEQTACPKNRQPTLGISRFSTPYEYCYAGLIRRTGLIIRLIQLTAISQCRYATVSSPLTALEHMLS